MTFTDIDIANLIRLTFIFKVKHFLVVQELFSQRMSPADLPRLARSRRGVAPVPVVGFRQKLSIKVFSF